MKSEFQAAINQVANDRNLPREVIIDAIRMALVSAYKRDFGSLANLVASLDPNTGNARIFAEKQVVEVIDDPNLQILYDEALTIDPEVIVGSIVKVDITPSNFGRIAAQTAKQVILQRIREAKRDHLFTNYAEREGEMVTGVVSYVGPAGVTLNLGDEAEATLPSEEMIKGEYYRRDQRVRAYIYKVEKVQRGPQILVSRTHKKMLLRLLEMEVPEIANGVVEVRAIAREPGQRSKVAVSAQQPGIDPVGACVGMRGGRIQHIVEELSGEKIDIVPWSADTAQFIANALSPAKVTSVTLGDGKTATVIVPDKMLSLAIGKEGQNARLAAKLTGWRIDIVNQTDAATRALRFAEEEAVRVEQDRRRREDEERRRADAAALLAEAEVGLDTLDTVQSAVTSVSESTETELVLAALPAEGAVDELEAAESVGDIDLAEVAIEVPADASTEEDDGGQPAMKGQKKAKKGKREIALEQRQAAERKKKAAAAPRHPVADDDLDWQHLRNVKADEILKEEEIPAPATEQKGEPEE
ncbi:MAG: transcription termination/antitermination protein NusA [Chloroflexi bacterium]|nr:transcription termination/antitermination protein NusA [Chloroflexota bacterium]